MDGLTLSGLFAVTAMRVTDARAPGSIGNEIPASLTRDHGG